MEVKEDKNAGDEHKKYIRKLPRRMFAQAMFMTSVLLNI